MYLVFRLDVEDDDGQLYYISLERVSVLDRALETLKIGDRDGDPELYHSVLVRPYLNCLPSDSEELLTIVRRDLLVPWSGEQYNFSVPVQELDITSLQGEVGQPKEVDDLVYGGKLKNGFFIEAGAFNFETNSDSLYFELSHNWTGLLVEPHPLAFHQGVSKHRRVTSVRTCLSTTGQVHTAHFDLSGSVRNETAREAMSGLVHEANTHTAEMQCLPLYTLLLALGNPTVHYFSLDIEGAEFQERLNIFRKNLKNCLITYPWFQVLQTIPWGELDIWVISVETHLAGLVFPGSREEIVKYMDSVGYRLVNWTEEEMRKDDLFVRKDIELRGSGVSREEL